jgi:hypothetical protein
MWDYVSKVHEYLNANKQEIIELSEDMYELYRFPPIEKERRYFFGRHTNEYTQEDIAPTLSIMSFPDGKCGEYFEEWRQRRRDFLDNMES